MVIRRVVRMADRSEVTHGVDPTRPRPVSERWWAPLLRLWVSGFPSGVVVDAVITAKFRAVLPLLQDSASSRTFHLKRAGAHLQ